LDRQTPPKSSSANDIVQFWESVGQPVESYPTLLGLDPVEAPGLLRLVEDGLDFSALERFQRNAALTTAEITELLGIPSRTLARRRERGVLEVDESDRLLRFSRVLGAAIELFEGDGEAALRWLRAPQRALGGEMPFAMARTELGARHVEQLIGRLEHGVFS
jgi:putative toxin-antitoxin system antitoxin component (TIGR02293 family)